MKKIALAIGFVAFGLVAYAEKYSYYYYQVKSNGSIAITNTVSTIRGAVKIPSSINGMVVSEIGKDDARGQVWNGSAFADAEGAEYLVRPETAPASVKLFIESLTGSGKALLSSSLLTQSADFSTAGKVKVTGSTAVSVSFDKATLLTKFTFVNKKQTYRFEGVILGEGESAGIHGVLSRTADGKKFVYAKADIVKPED